jgi:predicted metal-dependent peptidase
MQLIRACRDLLIKNPFYGYFLLSLDKKIVDDNTTQTACVRVAGLSLELLINQTFWDSLKDEEQLAILTHELMHICMFHLTEPYQVSDHMLMNVACDIVVNQYISNLPSNAVTLQKINREYNLKLEEHKGAFYYYDNLKKAGLGGSGMSTIDDHSKWPEHDDSSTDTVINASIASRLKDTSEYIGKIKGSIPGELSDILNNLVIKPQVYNWKSCFRKVIGKSITSDIFLTRMKPNKRFPDSKGMKFVTKPNILVGVDTSGSISNAELEEFFSEIYHMYRSSCNITVLECDTNIQNKFEYKGNYDIKISGRGGTELSPVIDYYKKHSEYSCCVLFTDGFCDTKLQPCRNLIWVISSKGNKTATYSPGYTILIP